MFRRKIQQGTPNQSKARTNPAAEPNLRGKSKPEEGVDKTSGEEGARKGGVWTPRWDGGYPRSKEQGRLTVST